MKSLSTSVGLLCFDSKICNTSRMHFKPIATVHFAKPGPKSRFSPKGIFLDLGVQSFCYESLREGTAVSSTKTPIKKLKMTIKLQSKFLLIANATAIGWVRVTVLRCSEWLLSCEGLPVPLDRGSNTNTIKLCITDERCGVLINYNECNSQTDREFKYLSISKARGYLLLCSNYDECCMKEKSSNTKKS